MLAEYEGRKRRSGSCSASATSLFVVYVKHLVAVARRDYRRKFADSEIKQYDLVALKDDKAFFPPYQGAPLLGKKTLEEMPELRGILNLLAGKVTENEMIKMNYEVKVKGRTAYDVAKEYLDKNKTK